MRRSSVTDVLQSRTSITADAAGSKILTVPSALSIEMWVKVYDLTADADINVLLEGTTDDTSDDPVWATVKSVRVRASDVLVDALAVGPVGFSVGAVRDNGDAFGSSVRCRVSGLASGDTQTLDYEVKALIRA